MFGRWRDRLLLASALVVGLLALSARLAVLPTATMALAVSAVCAALGFGVERTLARRLRVHATDGILAAAALTATTRWSYRGAWHGVGLLAIGAALALAWPPSVPAGLLGYAAGGIAQALVRPALARLPRTEGSPLSRAGELRERAAARLWLGALLGVSGALLALAAASSHEAVAVGVATVLGVLLLTPGDAEAIRFEGVVGKPVSFSVARRTRAAAGCALSAAAVAVLGSAFGAAFAALTVGAGVLVLQTLRIGLYRVDSRRAADILFGALLAAGGLMAMALPPLILAAAPLAIWWVWRRAAAERWRLAR